MDNEIESISLESVTFIEFVKKHQITTPTYQQIHHMESHATCVIFELIV